MFRGLILSAVAFTFLSAQAQSIESESAPIQSESRMDISAVKPEITHFNLNVQLGMSTFDLTGDTAKSRSDQGIASSLTAEFGSYARFMETGLMFYQSRAEGRLVSTSTVEPIDNTYLGIPLLAKIYTNSGTDGFFIKAGMITSFLMSSNHKNDVRNIDLIGSLGAGSKIKLNSRSDLLIEATYNRGFLDQLPGRGDTHSQGFLLMAGVAFRI